MEITVLPMLVNSNDGVSALAENPLVFKAGKNVQKCNIFYPAEDITYASGSLKSFNSVFTFGLTVAFRWP